MKKMMVFVIVLILGISSIGCYSNGLNSLCLDDSVTKNDKNGTEVKSYKTTVDISSGDLFVYRKDVKDFGAVGDGKTDDTQAFIDGIDYMVKNGGGILFVPAGNYVITKTVNVPKYVMLIGEWNDPNDTEMKQETVIYAKCLNDKINIFNVCEFSVIMNLKFYYPDQNASDIKIYAPTIRMFTGAGARNLTFVNSYNAIEANGSAIYVDNIYGTVLNIGMSFTNSYEISSAVNIELSAKYWKNYDKSVAEEAIIKYTKENTTAVKILKSDEIMLYDVKIADEYRNKIVVAPDKTSESPVNVAWGGFLFLNGAQPNLSLVPEEKKFSLVNVDEIKGVNNYKFDFLGEKRSTKDDVFNIKDCGALGDGETDDSDAIIVALDKAKKNGGGTVFVPAGKYLINKQLTIPENTELKGEWYGYQADHSPSKLIFGYGEGDDTSAYINMQSNSGLHGLEFRIKDMLKGDTYESYDKKFPYIVRGNGSGIYLEYLNMLNAYNGFDFDSYKCDGLNVKGLWGTALKNNMIIGGGSKNIVLQNVAFTYGFWDDYYEDQGGRVPALQEYYLKNSIGIIFNDVTTVRGFSVFAYSTYSGFEFRNAKDVIITRIICDVKPGGGNGIGLMGGDDITFVYFTCGAVNPSRIFTAFKTFEGKCRIFGQNIFWGNAMNVLNKKNVEVYSKKTDKIDPVDHQKYNPPAVKNGCKGCNGEKTALNNCVAAIFSSLLMLGTVLMLKRK